MTGTTEAGQNPPGDGARTRLLNTGRRLFAERGIGVVSLREISREAGVNHATAVQYHFGDRDGLLAAIRAEHEPLIDTGRDAMLEEYEASAARDLRALAGILVRPLAHELSSEDGCHYLRIFAEIMLRTRESRTDTGSSIWRWRRQVDPFPSPGAADLHPRFTAIIFTAVELGRRAAEQPRADNRLFTSRVIDVVAEIIAAPLSRETCRLQIERGGQQNRAIEDRSA